jgi:predicted RNA-binding Zn-ribbon protein involved in translation (DUF1610 family)
MYTDGEGVGARVGKPIREKSWPSAGSSSDYPFGSGKRFVRCICPKCGKDHKIFMLWSGRGQPRKYCTDCKAIISAYEQATLIEPYLSTSGHVKKRGRNNREE